MREDGRTATETERTLLTLLRQEPGLSRAELGRRAGLAGYSVSRLVDGLMARALVREGAAVAKGRGHPATGLFLRADGACSVGLSLMTDAVELVLTDLTGTVLARRGFRLESVEIEWTSPRVLGAIDGMLADSGLDRARFLGVGLAITGFFVGERAQVNPPDPLAPWALRDLEPILSQAWGCGVWVDNDGNAAALGEASTGAGLRHPTFAYLFFAAGFGGGMVVDGRLMRGRNGNAGEFGAGLPPGFVVPSLERLRRLVVDRAGVEVGLADLLADIDLTKPGVETWLEEAAASLNVIVSSICGAFDPDAIVLGGRLPPVLAEALLPRLHVQNPPRRGRARPEPAIVASAVREDAAAVGAAALPLQAAFFS